jgi:hypothetical protein
MVLTLERLSRDRLWSCVSEIAGRNGPDKVRLLFVNGGLDRRPSNRSKLMTFSIRTGFLAGAAAVALSAAASVASAQTTTAPSGTDCSSASAANSQACQNQLNQPGMINNNTQTPIPQTNSPAVGPQGGSGSGGGSSGLGGDSSGGSVGGSGGSAGGSSGGGAGGGSSSN